MSEKQQSRGVAILAILKILKKHTDREHSLSQHSIQKLLESEYKMNADRKTVRRNLSKLMEYGFPIHYQGKDYEEDEIIRKGKNGEEELIMTNWYYDHEFTNGELRFLIDNVMFTAALTKRYRQDLIAKLESLSTRYFRSEMPKIDMDIFNRLENADIFGTFENIGLAIADEKQISFYYYDCGTDCKLYPRLNADGTRKKYIVNPYQLVSANGHPYLICNLSPYDDLTHFRLDRIKDSQLLDTPAKPLRKLQGFETGMRLSVYLAEHPNLWSGEAVHIVFRCKQYMMNDVADSFGTKVRIEILPDNMMKVHLRASEQAMLHWAVQFADEVEVLSPENLRNRIADTLHNVLKKYDSKSDIGR